MSLSNQSEVVWSLPLYNPPVLKYNWFASAFFQSDFLVSSAFWAVLCADCFCFSADNHTMVSHSAVSIRILDVNDNPPELATPYEASICEDAKPGQVSYLLFHFSSNWIY